MKKILLSLSLFLSIASFAQKINYGAAAGVTVYNMRGEAIDNLKNVLGFTNDIITTQPVTGFYAGGFATFPLTNNLSLEPGLYYSSKGYELSGSYTVKDIDILTANARAKLQTSYIDLPLLLKANFNGLQVFAGPQISYLTHANLNTKASVVGFNLLNKDIDVTKQFNQWDAGVTGGIGYQFPNGIRITAAYERGLSKVDAEKNIQSYNQGFKIGAAFSF